jgi:hypothetical protein
MKKSHKGLLIFIALLITMPVINSCKKGEEDPWFSFYTRTNRLCQDWKVISFKRTEQTNANIIAYTYDGASGTFKKIMSNYTYSSPGSMNIFFSRTGFYTWDQAMTTDTSSYQYAEKGLWYFSGGSKDSDTKKKELLALQKTELTESFGTGGLVNTFSYTGSGDLETNMYRLRKLSGNEVIFENEIRSNFVDLSGSQLVVIKTEVILEAR